MKFSNFHLSYCSNIHPGESWEATFENLKHYIPEVRKNLDFEGPFGIGLRLSHEASLILEMPEELARFQTWLQEENAYVFTLNGFPYGDFHRTVVKDQVHFPDWTTPERKDYTIRSFKILAQLLPEGQDGGISTSPVSYRHWFKTQEAFDQGMEVATSHLMEVVTELSKIEAETGKLLHLDIEPEPDGILENSDEMVWLFTDWLLPKGAPELAKTLGISPKESEALIKRHIQVCYDVCHFAIVYEKPEETFEKFAKAGLKIGKVQISAALKLMLDQDRGILKDQLSEFAESTYLHQVVGRNTDGSLISYPDLLPALEKLEDAKEEEWRIHFHVPVFMKKYGEFESTNFLIEEVLKVLQSKPELSNHLEVETYTWEVLPPESRLPLAESISRELAWVISQLN
ncbi:metabolite traffic protein EboE [Algoriphagus zhangzhouensis]|uniref:Xylose isomerase-like TIM barrel n=1 Tax=Algoriphagus zhangzhouensis TaxID=1073327 RepID=A0A1M7Z9Q9_9BACT|nr:metabolite traffic protein EboE [Algoriphagus zhangzhouensis]TDY47308.1 hypothetical protein A8938_1761 [Algoriphagus zhangzhouensis]SHO61678.1 hypothetical protein SAMN04488108_1501 [Algoriphagus zhangzhouensis]